MAYPIKVEGVLLWGNRKGTLREEELNRLLIPSDSILHLLRHFQQVPPDWKKRIMERGAREEDIQKEIAQPGSWWNPKLESLNTPEKVIQFSLEILRRALRQNRTIVWIYRRGKEVCYSSHLITPRLKQELLGMSKEPIGIGGIISLEALPPKVVIEKEERKASPQEKPVAINVVKIIPPPATDRVVISLARKSNGEIRPWTIYPGTISPSLPTTNQFPEERTYNQAFWEKHALIK